MWVFFGPEMRISIPVVVPMILQQYLRKACGTTHRHALIDLLKPWDDVELVESKRGEGLVSV